jgi:hypothetical protein
MNDPSQHEYDDELLSAYLDDELSAKERALVESRLVADPAARQTLDHLRNVSQSIRDLPTECIGYDLRDSILQRATAASRAVPGPESKTTHNHPTSLSHTASTLPTFTVGRTTRGWVWAATAIAAAILIMVLQPSDQQNADLPDVAQNDKPHAKSATPMNREPAADTPVDSRETPASSMAEGRAPATPAPAPRDSVVGGPDNIAAAPASEPAATSDAFMPNATALRRPADKAQDLAAATAAPSAEQPSAGDVAASHQPLVVRVLARRAAVENQAFAALLQKNGVVLQPAARQLKGEGKAVANAPAPAAAPGIDEPLAEVREDEAIESERKDARTAVASRPEIPNTENIELVLVEAPPQTILSCLNELRSDADNYAGIAVDVPSAADGKQPDASPQESQQASEFARFNRGAVPLSPETVAGARLNVDHRGDEDHNPRVQQRFFAKSLDEGSSDKEKYFAFGGNNTTDRGRAQRLQLPAVDRAEDLGASSNAAPNGALFDAEQKRLWGIDQSAESATADDQRMQVLFVIRPSDEPVPSLKAKNQPQ